MKRFYVVEKVNYLENLIAVCGTLEQARSIVKSNRNRNFRIMDNRGRFVK